MKEKDISLPAFYVWLVFILFPAAVFLLLHCIPALDA
jgi:hypothetical protein